MIEKQFNGGYTGPISPDNVLSGGIGKLKEVLVLGWDNNLDLYLAASDADLARALLLVESARDDIMRRLSRK
jgi:hypothetical protein